MAIISLAFGIATTSVATASETEGGPLRGVRHRQLTPSTTLVINSVNTWFADHESRANDCGGHLASVHSEQDGVDIKTLYEKHGGMQGIKHHSVYLGGESDNDANKWSWTDSTDFDYANWREDPSEIVSPGQSWAIRGICMASDDCVMSALSPSFVMPGAYLLPDDYMDKYLYPLCNTAYFLT